MIKEQLSSVSESWLTVTEGHLNDWPLSSHMQSNACDKKACCRMGTTFWLLGNNEEIYADMSRGPLGCVVSLEDVFILNNNQS